MSDNPLSGYIRTPKIYVRLPSNGRFNKEKIVFTANNEIPVRATTIRDDLILKNPDALLNGDATEQVLKSCVPEITNLKETPVNDIDVLLLAIQYASHGDNFEFKTTCPKCEQLNTYNFSIRSMIEAATEIPEINSVTFTEGDAEITVIVKPYSYESNTKASLVELDSQKRMKYIKSIYSSNFGKKFDNELERLQNNEEAEKLISQQLSEAYDSMAKLSTMLMLESVIQINIKKENGTPIIVTNKEHIAEYVVNLTSDKNSLIKEKIDEIMTYGLNKKPSLTCTSVISESIVDPETNESKTVEHVCGHVWQKEEVGYDQSNFFVSSLVSRKEKK